MLQNFTHYVCNICTEQRIDAGLQAAVHSNSGYDSRLEVEVRSRRSIQNAYIHIVCTTPYWFPRPRCVFWTNNSGSCLFQRNAIGSGSRHIVAEKFVVWYVGNNIPFLWDRCYYGDNKADVTTVTIRRMLLRWQQGGCYYGDNKAGVTTVTIRRMLLRWQ